MRRRLDHLSACRLVRPVDLRIRQMLPLPCKFLGGAPVLSWSGQGTRRRARQGRGDSV
jgi:hypothetical protein